MKKQLLTKMLLVAACLLTGTSVWAGVTNIFSQALWTHVHDGGSGDRSASLSFSGTSSIDDNWTASFDVITSSTNSRTNGARNYQVALISANAASFPSNAVATTNVLLGAHFVTTTNTDYSSFPCTITVNDVDEAGTVTLTHGTKYTFTVSVSGTSMTVSIKAGETSVFSKAVTLGAFVKPKGIYDLLPRPYNVNWGVYTDTYSDILVTKEVTAEEVTAPSISVAYTGANRTVTITPGASSESNAVTTYYTTNGDDPTSSDDVYSAPLDIDADCTVKAITISSTSVASSIASQAVTVGKLKLATPTLTKTGYADGSYTVSMSSDQTGLAYPPASTTLYYSIDGGAATEYSSAFNVTAGSTVTGYVTATNYTNSDNANLTSAVRPNFANMPQSWTQNYKTVVTGTTGACSVILSETSGGDFVVGTTPYYNITGYNNSGIVNKDLNTNVGLAVATNFSLRNNGNNSGILQNGTDRNIGIQNLKVGDYIVITTNGNALDATSGVTLKNGMSTSSEYIFQADATEAEILFYHGTYAYVQTITVYSTTVSATVGANGYTTFASPYALDLTDANRPEGLKAYKATLTGKTLSFTKLNQTVPAGTGLLLLGETNGETYNISVKDAGTAVDGNALTGVTTATNLKSDETNYIFVMKKASTAEEALTFAPLGTSNVEVPAGKAYVTALKSVIDAVGARELTITFDDGDVTGITNSKCEIIANNRFFDLQGREVAQPTKGLYIVNGKKVVIK